MPRSEQRARICQFCGKEYILGIQSTQHKYCSTTCRASFHYNRWKSSGGKRNKQQIKSYYLKCKYNLTLEQYIQMLQDQNNSCKICYRINPTGYNWHVDHCHTTGKIRGLLCSKCNQGLGLFEDNIDVLKQAIKYLENFKQ